MRVNYENAYNTTKRISDQRRQEIIQDDVWKNEKLQWLHVFFFLFSYHWNGTEIIWAFWYADFVLRKRAETYATVSAY